MLKDGHLIYSIDLRTYAKRCTCLGVMLAEEYFGDEDFSAAVGRASLTLDEADNVTLTGAVRAKKCVSAVRAKIWTARKAIKYIRNITLEINYHFLQRY